MSTTHSVRRNLLFRALPLAALALVFTAIMPLSRATSAEPREPVNGVARETLGYHAIVNATLIPEPGRVVEDATIVMRDGVIQRVTSGGEPPRGARVWDAEGLLVHSALIEAYLPVEAPNIDDNQSGVGRHWNPKVMAERSALDAGPVADGDAKRLRSMGFAVAHVAPDGGVFRGRSALVSLIPDNDATGPEARVLRRTVGHVVALESGGFRSRGYPGSKMGAIALVRQTLSDTAWYRGVSEAHDRAPSGSPRPAPQNALRTLAGDEPLWFVVSDELDTLRTHRLAMEFEHEAVIVGSGSEYRRLDAVVEAGRTMVVPLAFAEAPDVSTAGDRARATLRSLMMWEQAPTNVRRLVDADADVVLTASKLPKGQKFLDNLRKAIEHGLGEDDALAMLTTHPAELLGVGDRVGRVAPGYAANLVVLDAESPFAEEREVRDLWIDGVRHEINAAPEEDFAGSYDLSIAGADAGFGASGRGPVTLEISENNKGFSLKLANEGARDANDEDADEPKPTVIKAREVSVFENRFGGAITGNEVGIDGVLLLDFVVEGDRAVGSAETPEGVRFAWTATKRDEETEAEENEEEDADEGETSDVPETYATPFGAYGLDTAPEQNHVILRGGTVWTASDDGIIEQGEVELRNGELVYVGRERRATPSGATIIDCAGKHITPGLIDCHSHTGISGGVNEGTLSSTAMVRIFDVINPDAIGWYRELAGGITAANQLHGSANAIGGQNSVVKLRWGCGHPDDMRFDGAPAGIKFALGENVKQSNWGSENTTRYPQTRMGVETFIRSRFIAAREYDEARSRNAPGFRRDLELEALAEILAGDRLVHCHSYRQDEILMLCRVAQEFGFTIGTFQHVLEGYKVAEVIKDAAIGGSAFADWWAYKYEVIDAIPENGAIMHDVGVVVSFNSDSDEMARRMNTEAAKAVKYGGVEPNEAMKFITLNAAIQLGIDDQTGSLERGKDADVAVWSMDPLSSMARCEATYVDGRLMFSLERDMQLRERAASEKRRLIQKILADPKASEQHGDPFADESSTDNEFIDGAPPEEAMPHSIMDLLRAGGHDHAHHHHGHDEDPLALEREYLWLIENGIDPDVNRPGECGCGRWAGYRETH